MSQANPLLQVKLTLQTQQVKECLPLLLVLIDARVIRYDDSVRHGLSSSTLTSKRLYEIYINPPKGTTDNMRWAEETFMKATKMGFPALIVRPQQNAQEGTSRPSTQQLSPQQIGAIVEEVSKLTPEEIKEELLKMRTRQRVQQIKEGTSLDYSPSPQRTRLAIITEALKDIPTEELQEVVVRLRERVRKEQAGVL